jgi:hypothetical protein
VKAALCFQDGALLLGPLEGMKVVSLHGGRDELPPSSLFKRATNPYEEDRALVAQSHLKGHSS